MDLKPQTKKVEQMTVIFDKQVQKILSDICGQI